MHAEEDDYWRRYDALCLDLHVRPWPLQCYLWPSVHGHPEVFLR